MRRPSFLSLLTVLFLGAIAFVGVWYYQQATEKDRVIEDQRRVITALGEKLDHAWASEVVADLRVDKLHHDLETGTRSMDLTFIQYVAGTETPSFSRSMSIPGEEFYVDAFVVKFDRAFVEAGPELQGKSLLLFRRVFGDRQKPVDGVSIYRGDDELPIPAVAQVDSAPTAFERDLWSRFWTIANDPESAAASGVAIAQGEAPHVKAVEGQVYQLLLRSTGGLDVRPRIPAAVLKTGR